MKISKINRTVREGVSPKTNKPFQILEVELEDGSDIQVFGPAKVGDEVTDIQFIEQYNVTQGKVIRPDKHEEIMKALREIYLEVKKLGGDK